eukprot:TRINITY_DN8473_c0_g1_i1.p1 TRINITY_DN8473_c0_g1~~TRINITY_DN8473_c0_g1_i1.p1  ORF type:complete len:328 (-),score=88.25 TRINITY_DN8473_c0_g1_i1:10-948(-)
MADFRGGEGDALRIRMMQQQREKERQQHQENLSKLEKEANRGIIAMEKKFSGTADKIEEQFKAETIGLVTLDDFRKKRQLMENSDAREALEKKRKEEAKRARVSKVQKNKLSFSVDDENEGEEQGIQETSKKQLKNPHVETSFLPDREKEEAQRKERELLAKEYAVEQERIKGENMELEFCFFDGSETRRKRKVKKGDTIGTFLNEAKRDFATLKGCTTESLLFVKEDLIVPHHFTWYDLLTSRIKAANGSALFDFGDNNAESEQTRPLAKILERSWYHKNAHIFPMNKWENYDPVAAAEKYGVLPEKRLKS